MNSFHQNHRHIYRLVSNYKEYNLASATCDVATTEKMLRDIPEVSAYAKVGVISPTMVTHGGEVSPCNNFFLMDSSALSIFSFHLLWKMDDALKEGNNGVLLSSAKAIALFGTTHCSEKYITVNYNNHNQLLPIVGVFQSFPATVTFSPDFIAPFQTFYSKEELDKAREGFYLLLSGGGVTSAKKKIDQMTDSSQGVSISFEPFNKIYFHSKEIINDFNSKGNLLFQRINVVVLIFTLLFGLVNFLCLSLVYYESRLKEFFIRKVFGGDIGAFRRQIFAELFILVSAALILAFLCLKAVENAYMGRYAITTLSLGENIMLSIGYLLFILVVTGAVEGVVTFWLFHSQRNDIKTIYNSRSRQSFTAILNNVKVVQLAFLMTLIVVVITLTSQIHYAMRDNLGYNPQNLYTINFPSFGGEPRYEALKGELLKQPTVTSVSATTSGPYSRSVYFKNLPSTESNVMVTFEVAGVENDFFSTLQAKLAAGAGFSPTGMASNIHMAIVNEVGYEALGGKKVLNKKVGNYQIVGVVNNIYLERLDSKVNPQLYVCNNDYIASLLIRFNTQPDSTTLSHIVATYTNFFPGFTCNMVPCTRLIENAYAQELSLEKMFRFILIAFVSIMLFGFFGISRFEFNTKAFGMAIKKLYGAENSALYRTTLIRQLAVLAVSAAIALTLGYWLSENWLTNYIYHINVSILQMGIAIAAGVVAIIASSVAYLISIYRLSCRSLLRDQ